MATAATRFRRLPPPRVEERARQIASEPSPEQRSTPPEATPSSDLFAHYGIEIDQAGPTSLAPIVEARACPGCGWWQRVDRPGACELCGGAMPEHSVEEPHG